MSAVLLSTLLGALAALPLLAGAAYAVWRRPGEYMVGLVAAFGAGALISAVSFELVLDAVENASAPEMAVALAAGAIAYYAGSRVLNRRASSEDRAARGRALMLGATLDGVPESFILGLSTAAGGGVSLAFFVAVVVSNLPEGMASAAELREDSPRSRRRLMVMWLGVVAISAVAAGAGALVPGSNGHTGAFAQSFAAGALLTMLTDDLIPEARGGAGLSAGLLAVLGFAVGFALHELGV